MSETTGPDLTTEQVAARFQVTEETVRRWLRAGRFPRAYRLGAKKAGWRIPLEDVEALRRPHE
jgi:excisionase family DNA binding protein